MKANRKDFEAIARILNHAQAIDPEEVRDYIGKRLATVLETSNPLFDRAKFLEAGRITGE